MRRAGIKSGREEPGAASTTVLVADDEESLTEMVASALRFGGFSVTTASSGGGALQVVRSTPIDVLVLDVNLGDMDGFDVCRTLRSDGHDVPVIFLTARDQPDDLRAGFRQGGDDYLTKPFSIEELGLRIEALLRRTRASTTAPNRISVDRLILDEDAHQVFWGGINIELSPTEFRLLRYLMMNERRVVSKLQILDYVWEYDFEGDVRVVETYVSYLRKKLGPDGSKLLQTVRGVGYVLRPPAGC
jgi:two-component system OmpR family response regulator